MKRPKSKTSWNYESLIEFSPDAVIITDAEMNVIAWNKYAEDMTGYGEKDVIGKSTLMFYPADMHAYVHSLWTRLLKEKVVRNLETKIIKKDGNILDVSLSLEIITDRAGKVLSTVGIGRDITHLKRYETELEKLKENGLYVDNAVKLTEKEKQVLYGLVKYPSQTDGEIARKFSIKRSTFTRIKNKLYADGIYERFRIPNFQALGFEMMNLTYGKFNPAVRFEHRKKIGGAKLIMEIPEIIFVNSTDQEYFLITVSKNFTNFRIVSELVSGKYEKTNFLREITHTYFPFELSSIEKFFDYSDLLGRFFSFNNPEKPDTVKKTSAKKLKENEKRVLYAIIKYPTETDSEIASRLSLSKVTINNIRNSFFENGFFREVVIPDMSKLGFQIVVMTHMKFNVHVPREELSRLFDMMRSEPCLIFCAHGTDECVVICIFNNYLEYKKRREEYTILFEKTDFFLEEPKEIILSLQDLRFRKFEFSSILKKTLEV